MADNDTQQDDIPTAGGATGPDGPTHEATHPSENQEVDQDKLRQAQEDLETPGGGH